MNRQKKPLHHNVVGRECRDVRGMAGFPCMATEYLEVEFSGQDIPPEKCGV